MTNPNPSPATRFRAGQINPSRGRQKAARDKISAAFLETLHETFNEPDGEGGTKGPEAIRKVRDTDPATYVRIIATVMPKQVEIEERPPEGQLTEEQMDEMIELMKAELERRRKVQEGTTGPVH